MPESARWLYVSEQPEKADKLVKKMAKYNKRELPEVFKVIVSVSCKLICLMILCSEYIYLYSEEVNNAILMQY